AELDAVPLKHRKLSALLVKRHIRRAFAVAAEEVSLRDDDCRVVEVRSAHLVISYDKCRVESAGAIEELHHLRRAGFERGRPDRRLRVLISRQEALREAYDLNPLVVGALQSFDELREVAVKVAGHRFELAMADSHRRFLPFSALLLHSDDPKANVIVA